VSAEAASLGGAVLLDTNVLSELLRAQPDPAVRAWFTAQDQHQLFVSAVTQAEMLQGARLLPAGRHRAQLQHAMNALFRDDFAGRVLPSTPQLPRPMHRWCPPGVVPGGRSRSSTRRSPPSPRPAAARSPPATRPASKAAASICTTPGTLSAERQQLEAGIAAPHAQQPLLGDAVVDAVLASAPARLTALSALAAATPPPEPAQTLEQVSILFLDVAGSTTLSQHLDPKPSALSRRAPLPMPCTGWALRRG
jgi:hypothetical protein